MKPVLANEQLKPSRDQIMRTLDHFQEMLRVRKSSPLFRLASSDDVQRRLKFHNTGPEQQSGLIVMSLDDASPDAEPLDRNYSRIYVLFNSLQTEQCHKVDALQGASFVLHPVQKESSDSRLAEARFDIREGSFCIPGRTTAVFVEKR